MLTDVVYGISEETYILGGEKRIAYGIVAYANSDQEKTAVIVDSIRDISSDKERICALVHKCNNLKISLLHFHDVVDDFLLD